MWRGTGSRRPVRARPRARPEWVRQGWECLTLRRVTVIGRGGSLWRALALHEVSARRARESCARLRHRATPVRAVAGEGAAPRTFPSQSSSRRPRAVLRSKPLVGKKRIPRAVSDARGCRTSAPRPPSPSAEEKQNLRVQVGASSSPPLPAPPSSAPARRLCTGATGISIQTPRLPGETCTSREKPQECAAPVCDPAVRRDKTCLAGKKSIAAASRPA